MKKLGIVSVALILIGLGVWLSYQIIDIITSRANQATVVIPDDTTSKIPITLTLPGADSIDVRIEDYRKAGSLWVIVNKDYPLTDPSYTPAGLAVPRVTVNNEKTLEEQSLRSDIIPDLEAMFLAAKKAGHDIMLASGFRSYQLQNAYYSNYVRISGEEEANKYSAMPGQSEHQTGLAFDISLTSRECYLETCFGETPAGKWLAQNAHTYGFILRYTADTTEITKYQFEPWHFRYVGREMAKALKQSNLTLDQARPFLERVRDQLIERKQITE